MQNDQTDPEDQNLPYGPPPAPGKAVAVAISAGPLADDPAKVVALGRGKLAEAILAVAFAHGVKVRTDADLAELLAKLDEDSPIPTEAVVAVAEILAKVYEANNALGESVPT